MRSGQYQTNALQNRINVAIDASCMEPVPKRSDIYSSSALNISL